MHLQSTGGLAGLNERMAVTLVTGLVIVFVLVSGCSETPGVQPGSAATPGGNPAPRTAETPAASPGTPQPTTPVLPSFTAGTPLPVSGSCPAGYVTERGGGSRCYAQCNPGQHCSDPEDSGCGTRCCPRGSVCCGGTCWQGPCTCSGGECLRWTVEKPQVVINEHY